MKINGIGPLSKFLNEVASLEGVKQAVKSNTATLQQKAQRYAPVDTGNLKRMITLEIIDGGFAGKVTSSSDYGAYQEFGTRYMTGTPYMRPALSEVELIFKSDLEKAMR